MGGADDQACAVDWPEGVTRVLGFVVPAELFGLTVELREGEGEGDRVPEGEGDRDPEGEAVGDVVGEGPGDADCEGRAGIPIAGASACMPTRLLPMPTARTAPSAETGQPRPRSSRPRRPDWETNTGAATGSSTFDSNMPGSVGCASSGSAGVAFRRTVRRLSVQIRGSLGRTLVQGSGAN